MRETLGLVMIIVGASLWPIGLFVLQLDPFPDILIPHLLLVIPGAYLKGSKLFKHLRSWVVR